MRMGCVAVRAVLAQMRWRTASAHLLRGLCMVLAQLCFRIRLGAWSEDMNLDSENKLLNLVKALPGKVSLAERKADQDSADTDRVGSCM